MDSSFNSVNMSEEAAIEKLVAAIDYSDVDDPNSLQPAGRRWEPVGEAAANDDNDTTSAQYDIES